MNMPQVHGGVEHQNENFNVGIKMLRVTLFVLLSFVTELSFAQHEEQYVQGRIVQGPYRTTVVNGGELSILNTADAEFPLSLVSDVTKADGVKSRALVDKYDVAGSNPRVESVFFYPVASKKNVLVLVLWALSSRGGGTYGNLYQVYAYEKGAGDKLVANKLIASDRRLSGIDGYQEGEEQSFAYKNAVSIKTYLKKHYP